jgi:murein peptide amidase A
MTSPRPHLPLDPMAFLPRFEAAARQAGFKIETYGEIHGYALCAATKRTPSPRPRIYLSAGIHGDEPAPPWTLLHLSEHGFFDERCTWFVCPLLHPTGFVSRTRENFTGVDLNRDYKSLQTVEVQAHVRWLRRQPNFDLAVCLHEDWEARGFYLYELTASTRPSLAQSMLDAVREHCPIENALTIDDRTVTEPGVIHPSGDPLLRETWPEAVYLRNFHSQMVYTVETPSALPLEQRVATHAAAVTAAVQKFLQ